MARSALVEIVTHANLQLARQASVEHDGQVLHGDARQLATLLPAQYLRQVALVVTSPPYSPLPMAASVDSGTTRAHRATESLPDRYVAARACLRQADLVLGRLIEEHPADYLRLGIQGDALGADLRVALTATAAPPGTRRGRQAPRAS